MYKYAYDLHTFILHCLSEPAYIPTMPLAREYPNLSPDTGHRDTTESASENSVRWRGEGGEGGGGRDRGREGGEGGEGEG